MIKPWKEVSRQVEPNGDIGVTFSFTRADAVARNRVRTISIETHITAATEEQVDETIWSWLVESGLISE